MWVRVDEGLNLESSERMEGREKKKTKEIFGRQKKKISLHPTPMWGLSRVGTTRNGKANR